MANELRRITVTILAVAVVTAALVAWLRAVEGREAQQQLEATAEALAAGIGRELDRIAELGVVLDVALRRLEAVEVDSYERLLEELEVTERYPGLLGVSRIVAVPRGDLPEVLAQRQEEDQRFRLRSDAGGEELRLILHVHPRDRNSLALGVDIAGLPDSLQASERSRASGSPVLTNVTQLVQLPPGAAGAALYVPRLDADGEVREWLGLTFSGDALLAQLRPLPSNVAVRVIDSRSRLFPELGEVGTAGVGANRVQVPLERFGQRWAVELRPGPGSSIPWLRRGSTLTAFGGLVVALLLTLLVRSLSTRERRAQDIAAQRTHELAAANADLADLNVALHDANAGKDAFLAAVSHELRTPLTVIAGFTASLRRMREEPELAVFLDPIDRNVRRLDGLVSDLLTLASLDAGAVQVFGDAVDLGAAARIAPRELAGLDGDQVTVSVDGTVVVQVDRRHVERILTNLLTNAVRHGAPPIVVQVFAEGGQGVLVVRDHGDGIDPTVVPDLFGRFVRGARTDQVAGTGLGLAIIRELVHLNGGTVRYRPADPGACFEVRLPLAATQAEAGAADPDAAPVASDDVVPDAR